MKYLNNNNNSNSNSNNNNNSNSNNNNNNNDNGEAEYNTRNTYQLSPTTSNPYLSSPTYSTETNTSTPSSCNSIDVKQEQSTLNKRKKKKIIDYRFPFHFVINKPQHSHRAKWRYKLGNFIESNRVQTFIVILIFFDLCITVVELFLEESYKKCKSEHEIPHSVETAETFLRILTLIILGIFEVEIFLLILAFGRDFFFHPLYVLDAIIITTSIVVDVVFRDTAGALLVIFRLWRVVRIGHGIAIGVEQHDEHKYEKLKHKYKDLKKQIKLEHMESSLPSPTSVPIHQQQ